jgi:restriction system protein
MSRKKQSTFEDLIEITSYLPWWAGLTLAMVSYLILHQVAGIEVTPMQDMQEMGGFITQQWGKTFAMVLQFIIPMVFVFGSLIAVVKKRQRKRIFNTLISLHAIRDLSWQAFELLISEAYRRQGYKVEETPAGADGGVDIILNKNKRTFFVQCKHWKNQKVGVKEVRELNGVVAAKGAYNGILVTSGNYTTDAIEFAATAGIELIDGKALIKLIPQIDSQHFETKQEQSPLCPKCGDAMVKRTAKRGSNAGNQFWGCSVFPECKGTQSI